MLYFSTVTTKGQATIPVEVRNFLNIAPGDEVIYERQSDGNILLKKRLDIKRVMGILKPKKSIKPATDNDITKAWEKAAIKRYVKTLPNRR